MIKWIVAIVITCLAFLLIGFVYEKIGRDLKVVNNPSEGDVIKYDEKDIHFIKKGEGQETIVFSSGNGTSSPYVDMYNLQKKLSKLTETVVYERPGYGWSDPTKSERTLSNITKEMETVLNASTDNESFIFVGHSMAALEIFHYAQKHPDQVKGIVLIDGVNPNYANEMENAVPLSIRMMKTAKETGVLRLLSNINSVKKQLNQNKDVPEALKEIEVQQTLHNMWNSTMINERKKLMDNGKKVMEQGDLGDIPLILFSAKNNPMEGWKQSQEKLVSWSKNSKQTWVDTDNHFIHYEQPDMIVKEIKSLLE